MIWNRRVQAIPKIVKLLLLESARALELDLEDTLEPPCSPG
jgi:hypothetical protein